MGLFGRGNKTEDEVKSLQDNVEQLKKDVKYLKTQKDALMNARNEHEEELKKIKEEVRKYKDTINDLEQQCEVYDKQFTIMNKLIQEVTELQNLTNKDIDLIKKQIESNNAVSVEEKEAKKDVPKKHLYDITSKQLAKPYLNPLLGDDDSIKVASNYLILSIKEVRDLKIKLPTYYKKGVSVLDIATEYNMSNKNLMYRMIWNIEEGTFDELIKKYENNEYDYVRPSKTPEKDNHLYKIKAERNTKPYTKIGVYPDGQITIRGRHMSYNIHQVIDIKNNLREYYDKGYSIIKIMECYPSITDINTMYRLIWNIEEGIFDKAIKTYENTEVDTAVKESGTHYRSINNSMKKPINKKHIKMSDGGELYINGRTLKYTIQDVLLIKERIIDFNKYPTLESIYDFLDISNATGEILVWRIEEGYFDDLIDEYLSRNYTYENNFNRLFIDGKNTGLSIDKCISIIECVINAPDKNEVVNNLLKLYPTIDSKYIRIVTDNYNNPNLSKILKKETKKIEKIDNPQKRRENGLYQ